MDYKSFFQEYPDAVVLKVGEKHFPSHLREQAEFESRSTGAALEEVTSASIKKGKEKTTNGAE